MMLHCSGEGLPTGKCILSIIPPLQLHFIMVYLLLFIVVILDAPIGQSSDAWILVRSAVAKRTKICTYDRAGLGFSDRAYTVSQR